MIEQVQKTVYKTSDGLMLDTYEQAVLWERVLKVVEILETRGAFPQGLNLALQAKTDIAYCVYLGLQQIKDSVEAIT